MLYRETIAVCSEIHTKHINVRYGKNVEFFGAFAKFWKSTMSSVISVRPSILNEQLGSNWKHFHEISYLSIFWKTRRENSSSIKTWQ
jgi:hypothetical protein